MKNNIISISITYNPELELLLSQLTSLAKQVSYMLVVDNNSDNINEISSICSNFTNCLLMPLDSNMGIAHAQNIGIKKSHELNSSHVILFDQDSIPDQLFINNLLLDERELINKNINVAAIGPSFYDPKVNKPYPATVYKGPFLQRVQIMDQPVEASFIIASGCLIRNSTIEIIGLMKSDFFIDYVDVEWSYRAISMGFKCYISNKAQMSHSIGDKRISLLGRTISVHSPLRRYYLLRNSFHMCRLPYIPIGYKIRECIFNPIRFFVSLITSKNKINTLKYSYFAISDGLKGITGPFNHKV
ncbi:rhamnosyltransferase [Providencia sp. PROV114]|uniref:rhamnosyltransferase n=1 Tax=Providencia sp. PROV114 TaxID=2949825 RepID=UPI002348F6BE|nr:rhamnosyltransferase [Providencia sp. PROV114]WOB82040.1 rhamnosyltransferase [Providencia sp. PROV114]